MMPNACHLALRLSHRALRPQGIGDPITNSRSIPASGRDRRGEHVEMSERVLVVEDEPAIRELISYNLNQAGFEVHTAASGTEALEAFERHQPDLVLLDLMLPGFDGFEVCRRIRQVSQTPIIMLTARGQEHDRVKGLELGADDYIIKPFSMRELLARVRAVLRRTGPADARPGGAPLVVGSLRLDPERHEVLLDGRPVELRPKEFDLLRALMAEAGKTVTREALLQEVWGFIYGGQTRTVDVHVRHLRQKLGNEWIETVHGVGYRLRDPASGGAGDA